jgi:hypothetical protein
MPLVATVKTYNGFSWREPLPDRPPDTINAHLTVNGDTLAGKPKAANASHAIDSEPPSIDKNVSAVGEKWGVGRGYFLRRLGFLIVPGGKLGGGSGVNCAACFMTEFSDSHL